MLLAPRGLLRRFAPCSDVGFGLRLALQFPRNPTSCRWHLVQSKNQISLLKQAWTDKFVFYFAERRGFEPRKPFWSLHAFQACLFNHSSISPRRKWLTMTLLLRNSCNCRTSSSSVCEHFVGSHPEGVIHDSATKVLLFCDIRKHLCIFFEKKRYFSPKRRFALTFVAESIVSKGQL